MKKFYTFCLISLFLFSFSSVYSQTFFSTKYTKPVVIIDGAFGYGAPLFDFGGNTLKDFYGLKGYGINGGYYATATTKVAIANFSVGQLRTYLTISFAQFLGSDNRAYNIGGFIKNGWPHNGIKDTTISYVPPKDTSGVSSIRISSPYVAYGWEVAFFTDKNRKSIVNFGTDFVVAVLWGKVFDQPTGKVEIYNNIIDNTKLGLGFNLGYSYRITNAFGLSLGTRLQFTNLFRKTSNEAKVDGDLCLNDAANVSINPLLNSNRNIGFFGAYGGFTFYIGGKK
jgi:hypothetical protein